MMILMKIYKLIFRGFKHLEDVLFTFLGFSIILVVIYMRIIRKRLPRGLSENLEIYQLCFYIFLTLLFLGLLIIGLVKIFKTVDQTV